MRRKPVYLALTMVLLGVLGAPSVKGTGLAAPRGLKGEYFNNLWDYSPYGIPEAIRIDPQIDFTWGNSSPAPGVNANTFSVLWTGFLEVPATDTYTFTIQTDDRVTLRIGDTSVISYPPGYLHPSTHQGRIALTGGQIYPFRMTYQVNKDEADVQLFWESASLARQIVPASVLQPPLLAEDPTPADGAVDVVQDVTLKWVPGSRATRHDLYLSEDPNAVTKATLASPGVYRGRQPGNVTSFNTGPLNWGRTYYWRVDEVNEAEPSSPWKGPVWSFTTAADYIPVDDFESYTDEEGERIYETWIDGWDNGTGSTVGYFDTAYRPNIVHGGRQAMPLDYNNARVPYYSEVYRTWEMPQDWTINDVSELSLWWRGEPVAFHAKSDQEIVMSGAGSGSKSADDVFRLASQQLTGNGWIIARVDELRNAEDGAQAGVMIRESISEGSRYAALTVTANHGIAFEYRLAPKGNVTSVTQSDVRLPRWVRLTRTGDTLAPAHSDDGISWRQVTDAAGMPATVTMAMPATVRLGLCVAGDDWWKMATAEFSGVSMTGDVAGPWQVADIPWRQRGNWLDDLYIALEDSRANMAVLVHPDPAAVALMDWTQWRIPLSRFAAAGMDLKTVKTMYIGVGDRHKPQPNGTGVVHIDDIRVIRSASQP